MTIFLSCCKFEFELRPPLCLKVPAESKRQSGSVSSHSRNISSVVGSRSRLRVEVVFVHYLRFLKKNYQNPKKNNVYET